MVIEGRERPETGVEGLRVRGQKGRDLLGRMLRERVELPCAFSKKIAMYMRVRRREER